MSAPTETAIFVAILLSSYESLSKPIVNALTESCLTAEARPRIEQESIPPLKVASYRDISI